MATLANTLGGFVNGFVLWVALIVIAVSAFLAFDRTRRRDHNGLVDRTALSAIGTVLFGPVMAAFITFVPHLMAASPGTSPVSGPLTAQVGETWAWVAAVVVIFWMYALVSTIFVTSMYYLQQRRLRHHA